MEQAFRYLPGPGRPPRLARRLAEGLPRPRQGRRDSARSRRVDQSGHRLAAEPCRPTRPGGLTPSPATAGEHLGILGTQRPRHPWVDEYLLGVAAELEDESGPGGTRGALGRGEIDRRSLAFEPSRELPRPSDFQGTRRALSTTIACWRGVPTRSGATIAPPWPVSG